MLQIDCGIGIAKTSTGWSDPDKPLSLRRGWRYGPVTCWRLASDVQLCCCIRRRPKATGSRSRRRGPRGYVPRVRDKLPWRNEGAATLWGLRRR